MVVERLVAPWPPGAVPVDVDEELRHVAGVRVPDGRGGADGVACGFPSNEVVVDMSSRRRSSKPSRGWNRALEPGEINARARESGDKPVPSESCQCSPSAMSMHGQ